MPRKPASYSCLRRRRKKGRNPPEPPFPVIISQFFPGFKYSPDRRLLFPPFPGRDFLFSRKCSCANLFITGLSPGKMPAAIGFYTFSTEFSTLLCQPCNPEKIHCPGCSRHTVRRTERTLSTGGGAGPAAAPPPPGRGPGPPDCRRTAPRDPAPGETGGSRTPGHTAAAPTGC